MPEPIALKANAYRFVFWPFWFVLIPLGLAIITVRILTPAAEVEPQGLVDGFLWLVKDQPVPAHIIFFTLYEMLLYSYRHSLPFAAQLSPVGRLDVPKSARRDFEQAAHILEEATRIRRQQRSRIDRELSADARQELKEALESLEAQMATVPFDIGAFQNAYAEANRAISEKLTPYQKGELREYVESIGFAVGIALLLRACVVEAFKIPSGSMLPTLQIQDHIFVNKFTYGPMLPLTKFRLFGGLPPKRGDVMVFEYPDPRPGDEHQDFIKRVIALPGDVLEVEGGHPIINGWRVPNCRVGNYEYQEGADSTLKRGELFVEFLGEYAYLTLFEADRFDGRQGPYKVKPGEAWVLGDNRNNSSDSRAWFGGRGGGVPDENIKGRAMFVWWSVALDRLGMGVLGKPRLPKGAPAEIDAAIEKCVRERPPLEQTSPPPSR